MAGFKKYVWFFDMLSSMAAKVKHSLRLKTGNFNIFINFFDSNQTD